MTTAIQPAQAGSISLIRKLAQTYGVEDAKFYNMIVSTIFPSKLGEKPFTPTEAQVMAFLIVCEQYDLNPILREIYPFIDSNGNLRVIVGIDGWIKHVQRHPQFDGHEFIDHLTAETKTVYATTCKIYRRDRTRPSEMTEYMAECKRDTEPWRKWSTRMLKHKSFIQASRYAFGMSGVEDEDDLERSITVVPSAPVEAPRRLSDTRGTNTLPPAAEDPGRESKPQPPEAIEEPTKEAADDTTLNAEEVQQIWSIGMNRGLGKIDINKLLRDHFGVDKVGALRKSQLKAALEHLITAKKP